MFRCRSGADNTRDEVRQPFLDPAAVNNHRTLEPREWRPWAICGVNYLMLSITNAECMWGLMLYGSRQVHGL